MSRTVLVTGSSRGLGATIARVLVHNGFKVVINYFKSKDAAEQLVSELGVENAIALYADVTKREDVESMMQSATEHYGQIDVFVNNTLIDFKFDSVAQKSLIDLQWEDYQKQLDEKLKVAFHVIQNVLSQFIG